MTFLFEIISGFIKVSFAPLIYFSVGVRYAKKFIAYNVPEITSMFCYAIFRLFPLFSAFLGLKYHNFSEIFRMSAEEQSAVIETCVLYDILNWKTAESSYETMRQMLGNDMISFDDYQSIFVKKVQTNWDETINRM